MSAKTRSTSATHSAWALLTFVLAAVLLLLTVNHLTNDRIQHSQNVWLQQNLMEVLSDEQQDLSPLITSLELTGAGIAEAPLPLYRVTTENTTIASILTVAAPDGYNGTIELLLGIDRDGSITGARVTQHRETPGLGDDIDIARSDWIRSFDGLSLNSIPEAAWSVKRSSSQFDAFTGATITPQAVVRAVYRALHWFDANESALFSLPRERS